MIQVRNGVFETNSSSSHSLVVMAEGRILTPEEATASMYIDKDGEAWLRNNEYGRSPFRILHTPLEKLGYVLAEYQGTDKFQSILDRFIDYIPNLKTIDFPNEFNWSTRQFETYFGYIDHQSAGMLSSAVQKENVDPFDIVIDSRYVIIVDGDEYCVFNDMFESGLADKSKIKTVYPFDDYLKEEETDV